MTAPAPLNSEERIAWLRLARSEGIGPLTFAGLLARFGSAEAALEALPGLGRRRGSDVRTASRDEILREMERAHSRGWRFLVSIEPDYPGTLRATEGAPPVLCLAGPAAILQQPMVAIVGARNASGNGLLFTERLALGLGSGGFAIVSGLARGIDARAHKAALTTGTVAVLAGGHERIYPSEHAPLAERIVAEGGAVLSEMPLTWEPRGRDFPRRNRIVSGLCLGTVVVEAARRSGSLITARLANEQGREVFAVPGSPLDPRAEGTNDLLRQGATFCTSATDVVEVLDPLRHRELVNGRRPAFRLKEEPRLDLRSLLDGNGVPEDATATIEPSDLASNNRDSILALLCPAPIGVDDLVRLSGLSVGEVRTILVELDLANEVHHRDDGLVSRMGDRSSVQASIA